MDLMEFFQKIEESPVFSGRDIKIAPKAEDDEIVIQQIDCAFHIHIHPEVILENSWDTLNKLMRGWLSGAILINPIYHVSRIVGYFSRIENWNASKLGELRDRRKGVDGYANVSKLPNWEKPREGREK